MVECVSSLNIVYLTSAGLAFVIKIVFVNLNQILKVRKIILRLLAITRDMICHIQLLPHRLDGMIRLSCN